METGREDGGEWAPTSDRNADATVFGDEDPGGGGDEGDTEREREHHHTRHLRGQGTERPRVSVDLGGGGDGSSTDQSGGADDGLEELREVEPGNWTRRRSSAVVDAGNAGAVVTHVVERNEKAWK